MKKSQILKIAFIGQKGIPATYGGIENFTEEVSLRLAKKGHRVTVYCRPHYTSWEGSYRGVDLKKIKSIKTKHLDALSHTFLCSLDSLKNNFDIICYQALGPSSLCFVPRFLGKTKVFTLIHSLDWKREKWGRLAQFLIRMAEYPSILFPHKVAVVSDALKSYFEEKFNVRVEKITPGIKPAKFREPDRIKEFGLERDKYILFLGRLVPEKGCHYLLEAFQNLDTDFKLFIGGDGCFSDEYLKKLHQKKSDRIIFGGYVDEKLKEELFSSTYLFVLPSEMEGLPHTVLEALSYGKCVLASDIPENREASGPWGINFKNKDVFDLKEKLRLLLARKDLVNSKNKERMEYIGKNYSWDKTADDLEKIFIDCFSIGRGTVTVPLRKNFEKRGGTL
jgi:glycosyltransferase involved in cell wall biosynthesis